MTETAQAYRIEVREPDANMPSGELVLHYIALAATAETAMSTVRARRGRPSMLKVIAEGDDVMAIARRKGLRDGEISAL